MDDSQENDDCRSNNSDYLMEDQNSTDNYNHEQSYFNEDQEQDHDEDRMISSGRDDEDGSFDRSSGNYYDGVEESHEDDAYSDEEEYSDGEASGADNAIHSGQHSDRSFAVQNVLGNLAQSLRENSDLMDTRNRSFNLRQGHMNLSEVFPEILSILNDGVQGGEGTRIGRNERIYRLVSNVANATEDPFMAMESLKELSEHLLMMDQVIIERVFPVEKLLTNIINLLSNPMLKNELELQLLSCRCLYNLFEINPESISIAVEQNIILVLQEALQEISFIDLAEQVLETLELISRVHPRDVLRSGALPSCLQYLDFFTIHAQRKSVAIVSNSCSRVQLEDYDTIAELFTILKPIFINAMDQVILIKLLNAIYGICGALRKDYMLETLFTLDVVKRIVQLLSSSENQLDSKLKCLDIISVLVNVSSKIAREFIQSCDITKTLSDCFGCYSKSPNAALHETLMFVPKPLLHSIARTIALLFPTEFEQILSIDSRKDSDLIYDNDNLDELLNNLTTLMVEIYLNAVDFEVRRYVLIALARISSCLKISNMTGIDTSLIRLAGSTLAQQEAVMGNENDQSLVASGLVIGVLSLLDTLMARFAADVLPKLKREGIITLIRALNSTLANERDEGKIAIEDREDDANRELNSNNDDNDEEVDDDNELQFGMMDVPDQLEPKKIKFNVLRPLTLGYTRGKMHQLTEHLLSLFEENEETIIEELRDIEELVKYLNTVEFDDFSTQRWSQLWITVKSSIFSGTFQISSFEFVSTGLAAVLARIVEKYESMSLIPKRTFIEVFEDKLVDLIEILQSTLTRLDSFRIIDCGLSGNEGSVASLGKQVKIKLVYNGDPKADFISEQLTTIPVSIHCIASFSTLNEFLKHRMAQTSFLHSLFPGLSVATVDEGGRQTIDDVKNWTFEFSREERIFKLSDTVFGAIYTATRSEGKSVSELWRDHQVVNFRRIHTHQPSEGNGLKSLYEQEHKFEEKSLKPTDDILTLLKFVKTKQLPNDIFVNAKLSAKLSRQLEEPLVVASGILPTWSLQLSKDYYFLFPLETRLFFLQSTSFGYGRLIQLWRNRTGTIKESNGDDPLQQLGRITRHKLRISRETTFLSALKILEKYGSGPSVLEIEYQGEVGTGLGPTLEFYACVSREFSKRGLKMWRCESFDDKTGLDDEQYIKEPLFPAILNFKENNKRVLELFHFLGVFVARSMLDNRILDFCFSNIFFELTHRRCRNNRKKGSLGDLKEKLELLASVDIHLAKSLHYMYDHREDAQEIEQMTLAFTLPGHSIELIENGKHVSVTSENVEDYISLVLDYVLDVGIEKQLDSFIEGFSSVFPYSSLLILTPEELVELYGRVEEDWSSSTLYASINADHGYTMDSGTIHELISIMSSFKKEDRRLFLQFLTGSPKLPVGGFKSLKPKLTVVLKHPEDGLMPDEYLPSVMTCANYFKLPKYSSEATMRSRIVQAMNEGSGAFLLS